SGELGHRDRRRIFRRAPRAQVVIGDEPEAALVKRGQRLERSRRGRESGDAEKGRAFAAVAEEQLWPGGGVRHEAPRYSRAPGAETGRSPADRPNGRRQATVRTIRRRTAS